LSKSRKEIIDNEDSTMAEFPRIHYWLVIFRRLPYPSDRSGLTAQTLSRPAAIRNI
jgi:hypothetical protein